MRFFRYLIFVIFSIFSVNSYAEEYIYYYSHLEARSPSGVCDLLISANNASTKYSVFYPNSGPDHYGYCQTKNSGNYVMNGYYIYRKLAPAECWHPDYKVVQQSVNTKIKKTICVPNNGVLCKYTGNVANAPVINGYITSTFSSVSKTPDPNCKEELLNPPCDPKDPYGGCYTPPDDNCTRQHDGSILCPDDEVPPIKQGCSNGATYCKRPPQGCGPGYVSGNWNGEEICIKSSPPPETGGGASEPETGGGDGGGDNPPTGGGASEPTGGNPPTGGGGVDLKGVISAINQVTSAVNHARSELNTTLNTISRKIDVSNENLKDINKSTESIDSKMTTSNNRLSEISSDTARINDSLNAISDLLTSIKNNTAAGSGSGGNGTGNGDGSGTSLNRCKETDFTDDNLSDLFAPGECRGEYHKALNDINKKMDDQAEFDKKYMEWLQSDGKVKSDNDSVFKEQDAGALSNMLDGSLFGSSNAQCPAPWVVQTKLGSITLTFKYICQFAVQIHFVFIFIGTFFGIREFLSYGVTGK